MGRKKPAAGQLDLWGKTEERKPVKVRPANPLDPWWEAIASLIGTTSAKAAGGRVAKIAAAMKAADVTPEEVRRDLPGIIRRYAGWRRVIDITAVQSCWGWIKDPPKEVKPDAGTEAAAALGRSGGYAY